MDGDEDSEDGDLDQDVDSFEEEIPECDGEQKLGAQSSLLWSWRLMEIVESPTIENASRLPTISIMTWVLLRSIGLALS